KPKTALGESLAGALGTLKSQHDDHDASGILRVQIVEVTPWDSDGDAAETLSDDWTEDLDQRSRFLLGDSPFATFHGYDAEATTLSVRLLGRQKVAREGVMEFKDVALDASLKRQEDAMDRFVEDECVNPKLGHLLLYPEENRIGEMKPVSLLQRLEPNH